MWTSWFNTPLVPYTNFNNSVVLGSLVFWLVASVPLFFLAQAGVKKYRSTWGAQFERSRFYRAVTASKLYNVYRWFQPE
jgi:uncharacterized protein (TIGR03546 family)